jgi:hypothetical protein
MEILELKFAGVPLYTWCVVIGVPWLIYRIYVATRIEFLDWQERRAKKREYERMKPLREEQARERERSLSEFRDAIQHELDRSKAD